MDLFIKSPKPLAKKIWKKYKIELILIAISLLLTIVSLCAYTYTQNQEEYSLQNEEEENNSITAQQKIYVDISGAVIKPNVYELNFGARVKDILKLSGGLSQDADRNYFMRNFNLARIMNDQEKIYIPTTLEINTGLFPENIKLLNNNEPNLTAQNSNLQNSLININGASIQELDRLPGVGQITAQKIISNRPYSSFDELVTKKIINKSVFEKISPLISLD